MSNFTDLFALIVSVCILYQYFKVLDIFSIIGLSGIIIITLSNIFVLENRMLGASQ